MPDLIFDVLSGLGYLAVWLVLGVAVVAVAGVLEVRRSVRERARRAAARRRHRRERGGSDA